MIFEPFALERFFARYEFSVKHVLCASDCETVTVDDVLALEDGARERFGKLRLGYVDSRGNPSLRDEIARMYEGISREDVLVFTGAQEAILWFYAAVLEKNDEVIVHAPCYASHLEVPRGLGAVAVPWLARAEDGFRLDVPDLDRLFTPRTRAVVINSPHNPTGFSMPPADFAALRAFCAARGLLLLCDEVFRESEQDLADRLPAACEGPGGGVSLGVVSKTYGLAGLRVGWLATKRADVLDRCAALRDYSTICGAAPSEFLAEVALRHRERLAEKNVTRIRTNLDACDAFFAEHPSRFSWRRPKAGTVAFVRYLGGDVDHFCDELVKATGVLLMPGTVFDDPSNSFRIGFGRSDLREGLDLLRDFLRQLA